MNQDPYRKCECNSGKRWKFCCKDKQAAELVQAVAEYDQQGFENIKQLEAENADMAKWYKAIK